MPNPLRGRRRAVGVLYPNLAARFDGIAGTHLSIADNAALSMGAGVRMTLAVAVYLEATAAVYAIVAKGATSGAGSVEYALIYNSGSSRFEWRISDGAAVNVLLANTFGNPAVNTWNYIVCRYDGTNTKIRVENGADDSAAFSTDIQDSTNAFRVGARQDGAAPLLGRVDCLGVWKRALTDAECGQLYKVGVLMAARDLSGSLLTNLVDYWNLDGTGKAAFNANDLTAAGGVTYAAGKR